jgi:ribose 5-phosphate isomerase B
MTDADSIRRAVTEALRHHLGEAPRPIIDESVVSAAPEGGTLPIPPGALVTPLARALAVERRVRLVAADLNPAPGERPLVAIGADHGGYPLKETLKADLQKGYTLIDCGTGSTEAVDYPDYALAVAELVRSGRAWRGIMIDGAGIGSCMVANKVPGVRAALCYDYATAVNSREHNDANYLTLGAGLIGPALAKQIVETWLQTAFGGGRHQKRVDKIVAIDERFRGG